MLAKIAITGKDRLTCDKCGRPITEKKTWAYLNVETFDNDDNDSGDIPYVLNIYCEKCKRG